MAKKLFDFDAEFKLGIDEVDNEHIKLVDMLNTVHELLNMGKRNEAQQYFNQTLASYVDEHFSNEEKFMESFDYPALDEHRRIHENFKRSFRDQQPLIAAYDDVAFRKALSDAFAWIISHIGKTDRKYASFYLSKSA